jgi:hypothetical protein
MNSQQAFYAWSNSQQHFRRTLLGFNNHQEAVVLFLQQHAMLHSATLTGGVVWSFADEVVNGMQEEQLRSIPKGCEHSIAWLLWHIARTEDAAINLVLAGTDEVLHRDGWLPRLGIVYQDIGTAMSDADMRALSHAIDIPALLTYRVAVGQRTREVVQQTPMEVLKQSVETESIAHVKAKSVVVEAAHDVADYWGRHIKANLLLMPATRHSMTHLNEARRMHPKLKRTSSPRVGR